MIKVFLVYGTYPFVHPIYGVPINLKLKSLMTACVQGTDGRGPRLDVK